MFAFVLGYAKRPAPAAMVVEMPFITDQEYLSNMDRCTMSASRAQHRLHTLAGQVSAAVA